MKEDIISETIISDEIVPTFKKNINGETVKIIEVVVDVNEEKKIIEDATIDENNAIVQKETIQNNLEAQATIADKEIADDEKKIKDAQLAIDSYNNL